MKIEFCKKLPVSLDGVNKHILPVLGNISKLLAALVAIDTLAVTSDIGIALKETID